MSDESLKERVENWMVGQMPIIQMHGGRSVVREANPDTGTVSVELGGSCAGCGISDLTAQNIKRDLILEFDDVDEVHVIVPSTGEQGDATVEGGRGGELQHATEHPNHF
ncbi:NifU family protein [Halolamina salifodinae]|uniref:Fe-S cluster biogenesis protein NfuA n=1 Tax=Halolamina salifodinae TaxID=1202767 RepID=A0A8T4GUL7_9EURY|nr:NifU family protein [Halolamina salifodinae]MBP1985822.1 Fe-S cluster biogenesis protein NfuA [Halolamina salifodinae]